MKRNLIVILACAGLVVSAPHAFAQRGNGGSKPKPTVSKPTAAKPQAAAPKASPPKPAKASSAGGSKKTTPASGATAKNASTKSGAGSKANGGKSAAETTTASAKGSKKTSTTTSSTETTTTTTTGTAPDGTTEVALTSVQQKLQSNTNLADKLQRRLPAGTDLMAAADGYTKLGHFVSAVNVSNNLGIPFKELKSRMLDDGMSLGQAIQASKTTSNPYVEAQRAEADAQLLIAQSEQQTTTPSTTTTKAKKRGGGQ